MAKRHPFEDEKLCAIGTALLALSEEDRRIFETGLALPKERVGHVRLAQELTDRGHPTSEKVVRWHRLKRCACFHGKDAPR